MFATDINVPSSDLPLSSCTLNSPTVPVQSVRDGRVMELDQLVGTWELHSSALTDGDGGVRNRHGETPNGMLLYTADGSVSATVSSSASNVLDVCYAGRVTVRGDTVTHHVLVGAAPFVVGTELVRHAELASDGTLRYTVRGESGAATTTVIWRRLQRS
jgi:hypothetical protein